MMTRVGLARDMATSDIHDVLKGLQYMYVRYSDMGICIQAALNYGYSLNNRMTNAEAYAEGMSCPGEKYSRMVRGICTGLFEGLSRAIPLVNGCSLSSQ